MRHAAVLKNSNRLQKVLNVLKDNDWHSTWDIMSKTGGLCAVGSAVSELRANGLQIACQCVSKGKFIYRLEG